MEGPQKIGYSILQATVKGGKASNKYFPATRLSRISDTRQFLLICFIFCSAAIIPSLRAGNYLLPVHIGSFTYHV